MLEQNWYERECPCESCLYSEDCTIDENGECVRAKNEEASYDEYVDRQIDEMRERRFFGE